MNLRLLIASRGAAGPAGLAGLLPRTSSSACRTVNRPRTILSAISSIFSSVVVSRGFVNLWYGRQKRVASLAIGQVWKPKAG